ncbi:hypothetical protein [Roseomonas elaeocarpi]|uniref:Uncharacterized protein n=1 Tax=Roseomonas elaeocarpi TaxID=907779 RepID=A0ABV6JRV0_9PROT
MRLLGLFLLLSVAACSGVVRTANTPGSPQEVAAFCAEQARQTQAGRSASDQFDTIDAGNQAQQACLNARR